MVYDKAAQEKFTAIRVHNETAERLKLWCNEMHYKQSDFLDKLMDLAGVPAYKDIVKWREGVRRLNPFSDRLNIFDEQGRQ